MALHPGPDVPHCTGFILCDQLEPMKSTNTLHLNTNQLEENQEQWRLTGAQ